MADLPTIETLIQELASPDERRVIYAMEFLESLNKKHLITPLLLYHEAPAVRARALSVHPHGPAGDFGTMASGHPGDDGRSGS